MAEHRGRNVLPSLQSFLAETLASEGVRHLFTSIGGDNLSSIRAFGKVQPIKRAYPYLMVRGMQRPLVLGLSQSTYPRLEAIERPFEGVNASNVVA